MSSAQQPVLLVTHEFFPKRGGIATYAEEMALAAHEAGYPIEVWASARPGFDQRELPFPVRGIPNRGKLGWSCRLATARVLREHAKQVSQSLLYLPEPGPIFAMMYGPFLGLPKPDKLAITLHGTEILRFSRSPHRRIIFSRLLKQADRIGVVSAYNRDLLRKNFPRVDVKKIRLVPGALRHDFDTPPARQRSADGRVRVITVGRIHPRKGQHHVINALAALPAELREKVQYHIVGPAVKGRYQAELQNTAKRSGIAVKFVGEVDDNALSQHYADADIFAMTSVPSGISIEGFGLVYLEAAACGLPVVAHAIGGVPEAVRHEQSGLLVEPGDRAALTAAFDRLISSPREREVMAKTGRARAAELSWAHNVAEHFEA